MGLLILTKLFISILYNDSYKSVRDGTGKGKTFWESNQPWVPLVVLFILTTIWACKSPTNILESQPRLFYWMCGTIFSNITCRLIVAQVSGLAEI